MPREVEPSLNEKAFVIQALQEGLRLDGRQFDQYRALDLTFGEQYGSAEVTLGKTRFEYTKCGSRIIQPTAVNMGPTES